MPLGLPGRLSKGAGTHLASWLQEVSNVPEEEARSWLESPRHERTNEAVAALQHCHGKTVGHAGQILDAAFSGDLLVFDASTAAAILHSVESIDEAASSDGEALAAKFPVLERHRFGVQCRMYFDG